MKVTKNKLIAELKHLEEKQAKSNAHLIQQDVLEACALSVALCYCEKAEEIIERYSSTPMAGMATNANTVY